MRTKIGWLGQAAAWFVILGFAAALIVAVLVPRVAGATPYTVLTGSMRPTMPPGTLVVIKPTPISELRVGDVITYQLKSGEPEVVTHRVVSVGVNGAGESIVFTKGDANNVNDAAPVREVQVRGVKWYSVRYLGHVNTVINGKQRQLAVYIVAGLLLAYAAYMFISSTTDRGSGRHRTGKEETSA